MLITRISHFGTMTSRSAGWSMWCRCVFLLCRRVNTDIRTDWRQKEARMLLASTWTCRRLISRTLHPCLSRGEKQSGVVITFSPLSTLIFPCWLCPRCLPFLPSLSLRLHLSFLFYVPHLPSFPVASDVLYFPVYCYFAPVCWEWVPMFSLSLSLSLCRSRRFPSAYESWRRRGGQRQVVIN